MLDNDRTRELLELCMTKNHNPSISMTIYDNGKYLSFNAGFADIENKTIATENTLYAIASSTKAFAAEAICILAGRGFIDLDAPIISYLPSFALYDIYATTTLTVRDILCHRSGLPRHDLSGWCSNADSEEIIHRLRYLKPFAPVRYKFHYQNHMFLLASCLIEKVTGIEWDKFVKTEIMDPIGMNASFDISDLKNLPNGSVPYRVELAEGTVVPTNYYHHTSHMGAAGSINATSSNMAKWIALQLNDGKWEDKQVIPDMLLNECHSPQMVIQRDATQIKLTETDHYSYGLGWFIESFRGRKLIMHAGGTTGYSAQHFFLPGTGFGASILTNGSETPIQNSLMYSLIDLYFGYEQIDWFERYKAHYIKSTEEAKTRIDEVREKAVKGTRPSLPLESYAGVYNNPGYGEIKITPIDGALTATFIGIPFQLEHICYDAYFFNDRHDFAENALSQFRLDTLGEVVEYQVKLEPDINEMIVFKKDTSDLL